MIRRATLVGLVVSIVAATARAQTGQGLEKEKTPTLPSRPPAIPAKPGSGLSKVDAKPLTKPALLKRIAVAGASVSAGFGNGIPLHAVIGYATRETHDDVFDVADPFMGLNAIDSGESQIDRVLDHQPSLVIAVDFLFWYGYGLATHAPDEAERRCKLIDIGLEQIERLKCPVVLGDIPDMSGANLLFLPPSHVPAYEALRTMNKHVRDWAAKRTNVRLVPLYDWVSQLRAGEWVLAGSPDGKSETTPLPRDVALLPDKLHPSALGALALGDKLVGFLREKLALPKTSLELDLWKTYARLEAGRPKAR